MKTIVTLLLGMCFALSAQAAEWPTRPVQIITPLPVGSGPDVLVRSLAKQMSQKWNVPVTVDNRPGGVGMLSLRAYGQAKPDGHTIYYTDSTPLVSYPILMNQFDSIKNLRPLLPVTRNDMMLFTSPAIKSFDHLKLALKNKSLFGSWGVGTAGHLAGLELLDTLKVTGVHVPYRMYNQWMADVSNQDITFGFATIASSVQLVKTNKIHYIAYSGSSRHPDFPDIPTLLELTKNNFLLTSAWMAFYTHSNLPSEVFDKIENDLQTIMRSPETATALAAMVYDPWVGSSDDLGRSVRQETKVYQNMVKKHKISIQ